MWWKKSRAAGRPEQRPREGSYTLMIVPSAHSRVRTVVLRERFLKGAVTAAGVVALAAGYEHTLGHDRDPLLLTLRLGFFSIVCLALLARVFRPGRVTAHRVLGAVAVYVLLGVAWGTAFQLLVVIRPDAVLAGSKPASLDEAMWLSFITLTTTGYGDVLPMSPMARSLAVFEAIAGVLYPAILISRLVSLVQGADPVSPSSDAT